MPDTTITIPVIDGQPVSLLQDSKHALKTLRNNLFSGACLLTLGNHTMLYATICDLAFANGSPLYRRDVEKLDRQDDNAASHLFSADTLSYLSGHYPDCVGCHRADSTRQFHSIYRPTRQYLLSNPLSTSSRLSRQSRKYQKNTFISRTYDKRLRLIFVLVVY